MKVRRGPVIFTNQAASVAFSKSIPTEEEYSGKAGKLEEKEKANFLSLGKRRSR